MITKVLVRVEYHGQVWYEVKEVTMGQTHERNILRESYGYSRNASKGHVQETDNLRIEVKTEL